MQRTMRKADRGPVRRRPAPPEPHAHEIRMQRKNLVWLSIAIGVIVVGFATLAMGSLTVAPILLVGGFLGLVPYALMTRGRQHES